MPTSLFFFQLDNYLMRKRYNKNVVDVIPLTALSTLSLCIIIVTGPNKSLLIFNSIKLLSTQNLQLPFFIIYLANEFQSATIRDSFFLPHLSTSSPRQRQKMSSSHRRRRCPHLVDITSTRLIDAGWRIDYITESNYLVGAG